MKKNLIVVFWVGFLLLGISLFPLTSAFCHVPYLEKNDYTLDNPFKIKSVGKSIAVYAWLEFEDNFLSDDIDVLVFELTKPARVFIESLVPECPEYKDFLPWFALIGPGLPIPDFALPFTIPQDYGAVIVRNYEVGEERPTFFEQFGDKSYYLGPDFDQLIYNPGTYYIYFWEPKQMGGDYVGIVGYEETWNYDDIIRALIYTPMIRMNWELHTECK